MKRNTTSVLFFSLLIALMSFQSCSSQDQELVPFNEEEKGDFLILVAESQEFNNYSRAMRNHLPTVLELTADQLHEVTESQIGFENGTLAKADYDAIIAGIPGAVEYISTAKLVDKAYWAMEKKFRLKQRVTREEFSYIVQYHADKNPLPVDYVDPNDYR
jgi:hypothetical protein